MIRQTGGLAMGATSTRSRSSPRAIVERFGQRLDPELLAVGVDQAHLSGTNAVVDPVFTGGVAVAMRHHSSRSGQRSFREPFVEKRDRDPSVRARSHIDPAHH